MRVTRSKQFRRTLTFYRSAFGIHPPYKLLADGNFIHAALESQVTLKDQMAKLMGGAVVPTITKCIHVELRQLGEDMSGAAVSAKKYQWVECGHEDKPISPYSCILSLIGKINEACYCVGTQDAVLSEKLAAKGSVPILSIQNGSPAIESPSDKGKTVATISEVKRNLPSESEKKKIKALKDELKAQMPERRKKKKQKSANPLSCKKKKGAETPVKPTPPVIAVQAVAEVAEDAVTEPLTAKKRKRKRKSRGGGGEENDKNDGGPSESQKRTKHE